MGLLPCPNLPLWPAERGFSSSDENHFPPPKNAGEREREPERESEREALSLLQQFPPFPSKSPKQLCRSPGRIGRVQDTVADSRSFKGGNTCAQICAFWTRFEGFFRCELVITWDNYPAGEATKGGGGGQSGSRCCSLALRGDSSTDKLRLLKRDLFIYRCSFLICLYLASPAFSLWRESKSETSLLPHSDADAHKMLHGG